MAKRPTKQDFKMLKDVLKEVEVEVYKSKRPTKEDLKM